MRSESLTNHRLLIDPNKRGRVRNICAKHGVDKREDDGADVSLDCDNLYGSSTDNASDLAQI